MRNTVALLNKYGPGLYNSCRKRLRKQPPNLLLFKQQKADCLKSLHVLKGGGQCSFFLDIPLEAGCSIHSDEWGEGGGWAEAERATEEDKKNGFKVELLA